MPAAVRVVLLGFSAFERDVLRTFFRLSQDRGYTLADTLADAQRVVADADHAGAVAAVAATRRESDTVFVGAHAPLGAMSRLPRPVDALLVLRELDAIGGRPDAPVAAPPPPPSLPAVGDAHALHAVAAREVLVVTPDDDGRRALGLCLEQLGLRATLSPSGADAVERIAHGRFDFVLLDVDLGPDSEIDGLALCRHIKFEPRAAEGPPRPPPRVVLLGLGPASTGRVLGQLAGGDAWVGRPLDTAALVGALTALEPQLFGESPRRRSRRE